MEVVDLWRGFIQVENGRLNSFWRNEVVLVLDNVASWKNDDVPAFDR